jgi:TolB-like protein/DNA-binding winged helix-turn-helix (wHTH) protein/Tfp pilus assembly protein PilF
MDVDGELQPHVVYQFGDFRLDGGRRLLFAGDSSNQLHIKPKLVEALLLFVEHRGELLTKNRLMAELWPGLVVEENSLAQVISSLRRVLGEGPGENRYLATVPGRGYRFVADVVRLPATADAVTKTVAQPIVTQGQNRRGQLVALISLAVVLGMAVLTYDWYARSWLSETPERTAGRADDRLPSRTLAVLPFQNLSADDRNDYLAVGFAESILHRLAGIPDLTLIARTSSFAFRDRSVDAREIGRALNARYLLEGSLQHSAQKLRVTAQLVDAETGAHLWSLRFDRTVDDIFQVEDEISKGIADALQVSLLEPTHPHARFGTEAYLEYLQGQALVGSRTVSDAELAIERFSRAIEIAPDFAAAYAALADAYRHIGVLKAHGPGRSPMGGPLLHAVMLEAGADKAAPLLAKALELDDTLGEAYVLRGDLKFMSDDREGAEADYRKGLALSPSYGTGHQRYALFLQRHGRDDEANAELDKAMLVDPVAPENYYFKAFMYLFSEETDVFSEQAESYFLKALKLDPDYHPALLRLGVIRWHQGRFSEAIMLAERAQAIDPRANWMRWFLVEFYLEVGEVDAARSVLTEAQDPVPSGQWVALCLYEQEPEQAAELLREEPYSRGVLDRDIEAYVLRDAAIVSGDLKQGREEILTILGILDEPFRLVTLAQVSLAMGNTSEAQRFAQGVLDYEDRHARSREPYRLAYPRAAALTLLGQHDAAVELLQDSFARGFRKRWWYALERDPALQPLRRDPRFLALAAQARAHATAERQRLARLRERGDVPVRTTDRAPAPGPC